MGRDGDNSRRHRYRCLHPASFVVKIRELEANRS
jgi:hypothetical protein